MLSPGLLLLADARFPAGGHAHSAGVEAAVAIGDVRDVASLDRYLRARLATTTDLVIEAPGKRIVIRADAIDFERG